MAESSTPDAALRAAALHEQTWGGGPDVRIQAPGRVNLIGEHTDYNDGFVLPLAIPFQTVVAASPAPADDPAAVSLRSEGFGQVDFLAGELPNDLPTWARYVAGAAHVLVEAGHAINGFQGAIATDIPMGASLSSSAALEVAALLTFAHMSDVELDGPTLATLGQQIENEVMGLSSGIMDQFISANGVAGHALLIDCRSLEFEPVPIPATVVILDTMTRRELVDSEYNLRRESCERAAATIGVPALRDATPAHLTLVNDETDRRRAEHVVNENRRTEQAAVAMRRGIPYQLGRLMNDSHASLRDLYSVSGPALDTAVDIAGSIDGCLGSRMTGGGFAGCAIALVTDEKVEAFIEEFTRRFTDETGDTPRVWPVNQAAAGAGRL